MKKLFSFLGLLTFLIVAFALLFSSSGKGIVLAERENDSDDFVADELIVKFKGDREPFKVVKLSPGKSPRDAEREFEQRDDVVYAEPNFLLHTFLVPNDPLYRPYQWHLDNPVNSGIHTETAWDVSTGSGVVVAVVDTGIAFENFTSPSGKSYFQAPDLANTCFVPGFDFVENDTHPNDDNSHGTHVAGTVAQSTNNGVGVAGVAFGSCLMPVKVLDRNGFGTTANVAVGIRFAADNGAKVINLSLGGSGSQTLLDAVAYAYTKGITVVAAAGNDGVNTVSFPAGYNDFVIAVGATRYDETLASYSNFGPSLDLVAPGGDLSVDQNNDGFGDGVLQNTFNPNTKKRNNFAYWFFQGTSMAAPHVSGTAALVLAKGNATGPDQVRAALESTADDLGAPGSDPTFGKGLVNALAALAWIAGPVDNPPTVSITSPLSSAIVSGSVTIAATATDDKGVAQVDFLVDNVLIASDSASPYETVWNSTAVADGVHTLTARATDTAGKTANHSISVTVDNVNDPPIANAGPDQNITDTNGDGVEPVTLNGSASSDPDGSIVSYEWFEGATLLGTGATLVVNFTVFGSPHTVSLKVTDNQGATASDNVLISVNPQPAGPSLHVSEILMSIRKRNSSFEAKANVTVVDQNGVPVSAAIATGDWSGVVSATGQNAETNEDGFAAFRSPRGATGTYTFTVTSIAADGYTYNVAANIETSDSIVAVAKSND